MVSGEMLPVAALIPSLYDVTSVPSSFKTPACNFSAPGVGKIHIFTPVL
jgi:hypothetical protein